MKKIFLVIALGIAAMACQKNNSDTALKEGKIVINASTRSEVSEANTSSKTVLDESLIPQTKDLNVEITGNGTTQNWESLTEFRKAIDGGLTFASAPHTVTLSYGEKGVEGWSQPYFEGSTTVDVPMYGLSVDADIMVTLANSIVSIKTTELFDGYFPTSSFKINGTDWDASKREMLFVNPGEISITCEAVRQSGSTTKFESFVTLKPTTHHIVVFDLSTAGNAVVNIVFDDQIVETIELEFELNENA